MDFIVLRPFDGGGKRWEMNERVPGTVADGWRCRRQLIEARFMAPVTNADAVAPPTTPRQVTAATRQATKTSTAAPRGRGSKKQLPASPATESTDASS